MMDYSSLSAAEKDSLVRKAREIGFQTETDYGNCIQSCLNGLYCTFPDIGITKEMLQASFGIAGGCGCSLMGTCGALNAAAWVISIFMGRPIDDLDGDYQQCHEMIQDVVEKFRARYDGILCYEVMNHNMGGTYNWQTPEGDAAYMAHNGTYHCASTVAFCAETVARMIVDGKLKQKRNIKPHDSDAAHKV